MSLPEARIAGTRFRELKIPFTVAFRHASAERSETETVFIEVIAADGTVGFGESCPRPYVTGETIATARAFLDRFEPEIRGTIASLADLRTFEGVHRTEIDTAPAAWCALELAVLDLLGKQQSVPVETLVSMPALTGTFHYTAILGDGSPAAFRAMAERYWNLGFRDFKVKLSTDAKRDREKLEVFKSWSQGGFRVRADANNLWRDASEAIDGVAGLEFAFFAIEEPIGAGRYAQLSRIARVLDCPIILDESCVRREQLAMLDEPSSHWLINVRVSKMGGLLRSLEVVEAARERGIGVIVGAQVGETSLLTRAGLTVARAAGGALVAQEGAFGTLLLEHDIIDPPLMFGAAGVLAATAHPLLSAPGLGIRPVVTS